MNNRAFSCNRTSRVTYAVDITPPLLKSDEYVTYALNTPLGDLLCDDSGRLLKEEIETSESYYPAKGEPRSLFETYPSMDEYNASLDARPISDEQEERKQPSFSSSPPNSDPVHHDEYPSDGTEGSETEHSAPCRGRTKHHVIKGITRDIVRKYKDRIMNNQETVDPLQYHMSMEEAQLLQGIDGKSNSFTSVWLAYAREIDQKKRKKGFAELYGFSDKKLKSLELHRYVLVKLLGSQEEYDEVFRKAKALRTAIEKQNVPDRCRLYKTMAVQEHLRDRFSENEKIWELYSAAFTGLKFEEAFGKKGMKNKNRKRAFCRFEKALMVQYYKT